MKKSKGSQATLFQSWGHPSGSSRNANFNGTETNSSLPQNNVGSVSDQADILEMGNVDDDDELLAAVDEIAPLHENNNYCFSVGFQQNHSSANISCNPDEIEVIPGFDVEAGNVWIYPTNYPVRNYQFDIVQQALFKNTLVTLPTGLGKTFIAAVVMYNFYRWYPQGKVIFMAPTKPLVAQQIEACFNIMGIPQTDTAEMTGNMAPNKRQSLWQNRRVFFLTPQVLQNDLNRGSCKAEEVVLLVADEAHKALGNHAYCQVVREISGYTSNFRVLALSATPGDDLQAVQQVITNLLISHMELRSEESPDIQPYTHNRLVEKVVVSLGEDIARIKASYLRVLESVVGRLYCQRALWQRDPQRVTKFLLLSARDQFRKRMNEQGGLERNQQSRIEGDFAMCISLYHAYELLLQHGILSFYNFIKGIMDGTKGMPRAKTEITRNCEFSQLIEELQAEIEPPVDGSVIGNDSLLFSQFSPRRRALMNVPKPSSSFKSHPKLIKLKEIVLEHFAKFVDKDGTSTKGVATRVMIFSQYRDSVNEIAAMLAQHKPIVRVMSFIGQQSTGKSSRGLTQKEQLQVVQHFRQGGYNTLVATCVGEEGLDIGEVDLIVCFDAHASPIRLVQRMGRTGRKRDGRIVILVTEGKEEQIYQKSQRSKNSIYKAVMQSAKSFDLYLENPRMVPKQVTPSVLKMEMTVGKFQAQSKGKKKARPLDGTNITKFTSKSATTTSKKHNGFLTYEELLYWQEHFKLPDHEAGLSPQLSVTKRSRRSLTEVKKPVAQPSLSEWLPWQTTPHPVKLVSHSRRTEHLIELLEFIELHGSRDGEDAESYDLEMLSFLNEEDLLKPGERDNANIVEDFLRSNIPDWEEAGSTASKITKKGKNTRKKLLKEKEDLGEKDARKNSKQCDENSVAAAKKNKKGTKKSSPLRRARWKEYLKQFEDKDEDFESDDGNINTESNENFQVGDDLQNQKIEEGKSDFPYVEKACEMPVEVTGHSEEVEKEHNVRQRNNWIHNEPKDAKEMEPEDGNVSANSSDEFSDLFPTSGKHCQGFNTGLKPLLSSLGSKVTLIPTPPSLESLDELCSASETEDINEIDLQPDWNTHKKFREITKEKDKLSAQIAAAPKTMDPACDSFVEHFLMADFLEEDSVNTEIELNKGEIMTKGTLENRDGGSSCTSHHPSKTGSGSSTAGHNKKDCDKSLPTQCNRTMGGDSCLNRTSRTSREVVEKDTHEVKKDHEIPKDEDLFGENQVVTGKNDFGFGVRCGSPTVEANEREDETDFIEDDAGFDEAFFMDSTDDEAFTNMALIEQDDHERNHYLGKPFTKTVKETRISCDLLASIRKLGAFKRDHSEKTPCHQLARNPKSESEKKKSDVVFKQIKRSLTEDSVLSEAAQTCPIQDPRTKGDHSNNTAVDGDSDVLNQVRNSVAAASVSKAITSRQARMFNFKTRQVPSNSRDGSTGEMQLCDREKGQCFTEGGKTSENNNIAINGDDSSNGANARQILGNNTSGDNCGINGNYTKASGDNDIDNVCRAQVQPKKLKLSRKRPSEAQFHDNSGKSLNQGKSPFLYGTNSLDLNEREPDLCGSNTDGPRINSSQRNAESRGSVEKARQRPFDVGTVPKSSYVTGRNVRGTNSDGTKTTSSSGDMGSRGLLMEPQHPVPGHRAPDCSHSSVDGEGIAANPTNVRTFNGAVIAVLESEEEDDEEVVIRPAKKAIPFRKRALSSPCSPGEFKRPVNPEQQQKNQHCVLSSESDEDFEVGKSEVQRRSEPAKVPQEKYLQTKKVKSLAISAKKGTRRSFDSRGKRNNNKEPKNHFLDDEAELSGSDINGFSSDEAKEDEGEEMDSFIDDSTQMTQRTPSTTKRRHASSPVDMMAVYRQSLRSPLCGVLNFKTPMFHKQRNRYKMVYRNRSVKEGSESNSEAEEVNELGSILENEFEGENTNSDEDQHENEVEARDESKESKARGGVDNTQWKFRAPTDKSFEESQIGRPVKRMKRKRILDDSLDEEVSPKFSKQSFFPETSHKESLDVTSVRRNVEIQSRQQIKPTVFRNFPTNTLAELSNLRKKSSNILASGQSIKVNLLDENRQDKGEHGSFHEWNNDISDSELLVAFEPECVEVSSVQPRSNLVQGEDLNEIAVAMEMTDDDVVMEISELPTFSLGLNFLSDDIFKDSGAEEVKSSRNSKVDLKEEHTWKDFPGDRFSTHGDDIVNNRRSIGENSASLRMDNFTKITPRSNQPSENHLRFINNAQKDVQSNALTEVTREVSNLRKAALQSAPETKTLNASVVSSDQRGVLNNILPLTTDSKDATNTIDQRSSLRAHAKLQVVTPSCRPNPVTRPSISPLLSSSVKDKGKTVILVDTREISSSQVVSILRLKHNIKAEVCQLTSCDYIVSNRMAVKRKSVSDVACAANSPKLIQCVRRMCDLYDRPCLVLEKDRVKPGETEKVFIKTKAYIFTLASIAQTHVKLLFSDSPEDTALLLTELADIESKKGTGIQAPVAISKEREQVFRVLLSIPQVSFITALNLCSSFNSLQEITNSSPSELEKRTPCLSRPRAEKIHKYLRHRFNPEVV